MQCSDRDLGQHRIVGLPVCIATELQHSAAAALQGCWATGLYLQGLLAARLQRSRARACGANNTPAHAKEREVNANVNSIILKSLPKFGKLFRIIEFTFAFTALSFDCTGAAFSPNWPCSPAALQCNRFAAPRHGRAAPQKPSQQPWLRPCSKGKP